MKTETYTGTITKVELRQRKALYASRGGQAEQYECVLMVAFETADGTPYWFFSPAASFSVRTSGPCTVAILIPNDWITRKDWSCKGALGATGFGDTPIARVKVGDTITLKALPKTSTRFGTRLYRVKRQDFDYSQLLRSFQARIGRALEAIPTRLRADQEPPVIPGVQWRHIGGHYSPERRDQLPEGAVASGISPDHFWICWDREISDNRSAAAHVEGISLDQFEAEPV